ncbi:MAG: HAMP domain-containing sensor histidine kinase [Verrucomicrobiota bacterium]|nr:HAMP domain-containing sensor histidine kinase [Verrucomicrobiota bacterium]
MTTISKIFVFAGLLLTILGLAVMVGWILDVPVLIKLHLSLVVMQFNAAFCFVFTGIVIGSWGFDKPKLNYLSIIPLLMGLAVLIEWHSGVSFVDELLWKHQYISLNYPPGRFSVHSALCFSLFGVSVLGITFWPKITFWNSFLTFVGGIALILGILAIFGYAVKLHTFSDLFSRIKGFALHTAFGFCLIGLSLWVKSYEDRRFLPVKGFWLVPAISSGVFVVSFLCGFLLLQPDFFYAYTHLIPIMVSGFIGILCLSFICILTVFESLQISKAQKIQTQISLLSLASHDMKTPLSTLHLLIPILIEQDDSISKEKRINILEKCQTESHKLLGIIQNILEFNRHMESPSKVAADLNEILKQLEPSYSEMLIEKRLTLKITYCANGEVFVPRQLLIFAVNNLVGNAIKFSPPKGEVDISCNRVGSYLEVRVKDQGLGIPSKYRGRIFKKFFRVPDNGATGTGLGLALTKEVVLMNGGKIGFDHNPGPGTTFWLRFPSYGKLK